MVSLRSRWLALGGLVWFMEFKAVADADAPCMNELLIMPEARMVDRGLGGRGGGAAPLPIEA